MGTRVCARVIGGEIGAGQDILAPQLYPKGHEQAQISEKHESEATDFTPSLLKLNLPLKP